MAPLVRTGGSRHTGLAAPPHRNIHKARFSKLLLLLSSKNIFLTYRIFQAIDADFLLSFLQSIKKIDSSIADLYPESSMTFSANLFSSSVK